MFGSAKILADEVPTEAERFRAGLPRACRHPRWGHFLNPWLTDDNKDPCVRSLSDAVRLMGEWSLTSFGTEPVGMRPVDWVAVRAAKADVEGPAVAVWLGHATVLCICRGRLLLFDPVFSKRCSPFTFAGPKRFTPCPVDPSLADWPEDLAPDLVAVSHAHYDHLDEATVLNLKRRFPQVRWVAPLGLGSWFSKRGIQLDAEMDWWEEADEELLGSSSSLQLVCLPAQHWSNRWPWDRNLTLWCGYGVLLGPKKHNERSGSEREEHRRMPFLFAGDTGYCSAFKLMGSMFNVDLAAIPIGAYEPRWFMSAQHCDPQEAVQIVRDLGAKKALAIHWGTFPLTPEAPARQLQDLASATRDDLRLQAVEVGAAMSAR